VEAAEKDLAQAAKRLEDTQKKVAAAEARAADPDLTDGDLTKLARDLSEIRAAQDIAKVRMSGAEARLAAAREDFSRSERDDASARLVVLRSEITAAEREGMRRVYALIAELTEIGKRQRERTAEASRLWGVAEPEKASPFHTPNFGAEFTALSETTTDNNSRHFALTVLSRLANDGYWR
jgi:hypothetical protein